MEGESENDRSRVIICRPRGLTHLNVKKLRVQGTKLEFIFVMRLNHLCP